MRNQVKENIFKSFGFEGERDFIERGMSTEDAIRKGIVEFDDEIQKAVYADTYENRKLGRVGQEYKRGNGKKDDEKDSLVSFNEQEKKVIVDKILGVYKKFNNDSIRNGVNELLDKISNGDKINLNSEVTKIIKNSRDEKFESKLKYDENLNPKPEYKERHENYEKLRRTGDWIYLNDEKANKEYEETQQDHTDAQLYYNDVEDAPKFIKKHILSTLKEKDPNWGTSKKIDVSELFESFHEYPSRDEENHIESLIEEDGKDSSDPKVFDKYWSEYLSETHPGIKKLKKMIDKQGSKKVKKDLMKHFEERGADDPKGLASIYIKAANM